VLLSREWALYACTGCAALLEQNGSTPYQLFQGVSLAEVLADVKRWPPELVLVRNEGPPELGRVQPEGEHS
jgi:hypothetical protein